MLSRPTLQAASKPYGALSAAIVAASLSGCVAAPTEPAPIWFGQIAPGAPTLSAQPRSWKERKFDGIVRQRADFSCGAAVMATIFNHAFGYETTEQQVLVNMLKIADPDLVREKGFSLLDMKNYALTVGLEANGYQLEYEQLAALDLPMIVLLDVRGYKHFVVVRKVFGDQVAVGDPALGNRFMSRPEFMESWNGVAFVIFGDGYDPDNSLLRPTPPLSARRLIDMHAVLPAAQAAEFGINTGFDFRL